jgi:hypothetical protein
MSNFQKKYGLKEDNRTKEFHKSRRMFCIYKEKLVIAESNLPYSHAEWFVKEGWMIEEDDSLMDEIVRGYVGKNGNIYFYTGYDFRVDDRVEKTLFSHLKELTRKLKLKKEKVKVYGGIERGKGSRRWVPKKEYTID